MLKNPMQLLPPDIHIHVTLFALSFLGWVQQWVLQLISHNCNICVEMEKKPMWLKIKMHVANSPQELRSVTRFTSYIFFLGRVENY